MERITMRNGKLMKQSLRIMVSLCFFLMVMPSVTAQDEKPKQLVAEELWKELPDLDQVISDSVPPDTSTVILLDLKIPSSLYGTSGM